MNISKDLVRFILQHAADYTWSLQGFGMLRLYLSDAVRLHVWDSRYAVPNVSKIHTHPWDFESTVVAGRITDCIYYDATNMYSIASGDPTHRCGTILCGTGGGIVEEDEEPIRLIVNTRANYSEGMSYKSPHDLLHESVPEDGSVTVVRRTFRADRDHAFVCWPIGEQWVSAEPREATKEEVKDITSASLARWFA